MIEARHLSIPGRLRPTDLSLEAGECVALVGPNGGGKTSLLRAMAGVEPTRAMVRVDGENIADALPVRIRQLLGFLPASRDLAWPIAVRDLIALGLDYPDQARVEELLAAFELHDLAKRPADELSTGERARVLMARVLASRPKLLLLDEPLSNLDPYWVLRFLQMIEGEAERGASVLISLHDLSHLKRFDRALLVAGGHVLKDETPDALLSSPAFEKAFRVVSGDAGFRISPMADRQSSR